MKDYKKIVSQMSLEDKIDTLTGFCNQDGASITRPLPEFDIRSMDMADATSGVRAPHKPSIEGGDVAFPCESAMAASFDRDLVNKIGVSIAKNCVEHNVDLLLAPAVNLHRNPLCGRNYEYFSEDPYLSGEMANEYIKGVQSEGVGTCLKHFALNTQEHYRNHVNSDCDERTMRELYFWAFERCVKDSNPTSIMCAYNKINGIYCSENHYLLTEILRDEWGYDGAVISDWGAVHNEAKAISAGLDLDMPANKNFRERVLSGLEKGHCTVEDIDLACERILRLVDTVVNMPKSSEPFDRKALHKVTQEAAADSMVLLQNEDNTLPIDPKKVKKLLVLGKFAEDPVIMSGHYEKLASVEVKRESVDSPLEYIKKYCDEEGIELTYEPLYDKMSGSIDMTLRDKMIKAVKCADLVLFFLGNHPYYEQEGDDRQELSMPFHLARLATDVPRWNPNVAFIQQTGCAVGPYFFIKSPKAILQMWLSGEGGGKAVADILFGKTNPSGKLPMTFMNKINPEIDLRSDGRKIHYTEKLDIGYRYYDKHPDEIWFPFGHGLSYTTFEYSNLSISPEKSEDPNQIVKVKFDVTNTGSMFGKEVVQVYVGAEDPSVYRSIKELKGFEKIALNPGETKTVEIELDSHAFAYFNTNLHDWHVESGIYNIYVGASSRDIRLEGKYEINDPDDYTLNRHMWGNESEVVTA